jgi:hypothetical protein
MLTFTYNFKKYFAKKEGSAPEQMEGRRKKDQ